MDRHEPASPQEAGPTGGRETQQQESPPASEQRIQRNTRNFFLVVMALVAGLLTGYCARGGF